MRCEEVRDKLSAFLDDELDPARGEVIEEHLNTCRECADALGQMKGLSTRLRTEVPYYRASDSLRSRVGQAAWSTSAKREKGDSRRSVFGGGWLAAAATIVVILGGVWIFASIQGQAVVASTEREVVSSHIRSLMANHLTDVASTDQHTVKPWFNGKLDFSPSVTDLAASGYPLIGGRLDYLHGRPVAALIYQRRKHWINVFTWPEQGTRDQMETAKTQQGYHVIHAARGGMDYWIVSDVNAQELSEFARLLVEGTPNR